MLLVTFHGGKPGQHPLRNNVHAYDKRGRLIARSVLEDAGGVTLNELRGIYRSGKFLYVANANLAQNSVLCYQGSGTSYTFISKFVTHERCDGIVHPFDFTFDDAGFCYVSSQDTNIVTRFRVSPDHKVATPAPVAPRLPAAGAFSPGTFVASSVANLCGLHAAAVPAPMGLGYADDGGKKHSVRGVVWANGALYVVDQPAARVKVYDRAGTLLGQSNPVESPVHLLVHGDCLYVTGGDDVLRVKLSGKPGDFTLTPIPGVRVKNSSGMAFSGNGSVYVASRTENVILKFDHAFRPLEFKCELPDNPEFLLHC